ncbi:hypothetical protein SAMN02800692_1558 [Luteibacter sp. UNC138MFCol5.1]|uniref:hypothetical protein n=1 Tax=Luteibacter sp. UNC138MFCol5.1 TaxID=1502774 RepID=UPI0008C835BE|nr:hypothetical protein [Luteibacter sp. UNC138MFCol5.1]SEO64201.1 hypothetical protein SAMN02800692_1558 [Luteibacter sp. UNC138MFCol5.1]
MDLPIRKLFDPAALPARDDMGCVEHPDLDRFLTDKDGEGYLDTSALDAAGFDRQFVHLESSDDQAAIDRYFEQGDPDFSGWTPQTPEGGWLLAGMWETEDWGPVAFYVREVAPV